MSLKEEFITVPKREGHTTPRRALWGSTTVGLEAEGLRAAEVVSNCSVPGPRVM